MLPAGDAEGGRKSAKARYFLGMSAFNYRFSVLPPDERPFFGALVYIMKATLFYTFTHKTTAEYIHQELLDETINLINISKKTFKDKNINILCMVAGLHTIAARTHTHVCFVVDYKPFRGVPCKDWGEKTEILSIRSLISPNFDFHCSGRNEDSPTYDEEFGLAYCFKEYNSINDIIFKDLFVNIGDDKLEELRVLGNGIWKKKLKQKEYNDKKKIHSENERELISQYITDAINNEDHDHRNDGEYMPYRLRLAKDKYKQIKMLVLGYYRQKAISTGKPSNFKFLSIRDIAMNYLVDDPLTNLEELIDFTPF